MASDIRKILHLYRRAGFGLNIQELEKFSKTPLQQAREEIFQKTNGYRELTIMQGSTPKHKQLREMTREKKATIRKQWREAILKLNLKWVQELGNSEAVLREKMALFWHGHFASTPRSIFHAQMQMNMLRKHALGSFRDLITSIAKDPTMILFLNNQQNRKRSPNENFARELMELFTLGRGKYSEKDIKEAARAFTGWSVDGDDFVFNERVHDFEEKVFFRKKGRWKGEDIINMILDRKDTATFICRKVYKYFVNPRPNERIIDLLADKFYEDNYDLKKLMHNIFSSDWFYAQENVGAKIKSPIELLAGFIRQFDLKFRNENTPVVVQRILGQVLFNPPNVAGWEGDRAWIDSSSLLFRIKLAEMFFKSSEIYLDAKAEDDAQKISIANKKYKNFQAVINWQSYLSYYKQFPKSEDVMKQLKTYLLPSEPKIEDVDMYILAKIRSTKTDDFIKDMSLLLTSLPEYQVC